MPNVSKPSPAKRPKYSWVVLSCRDLGTESIETEVARYPTERAAIDDLISREKAYEGCGLMFSVLRETV